MKEFQINPEQAEVFLEALGISEVEKTEDGLKILIRSTLSTVPFTNIMMLVRPRRSPTHEEIIEDMLSLRGGPCGHYNPFMNEVLRYCGFDSKLVPAWMEGKLSHMAITVTIEDEDWWLDFGNGHPYLTPIRIGSDSVHTHAGLTYRIRAHSDGKFTLEHLLPNSERFSENYVFTTEGVPFSFFDEMVKAHYTTPDFGPFLQGVRFIRFPEGEMLAVRDHQLLRTNNGEMEKERIEDISKMEKIIDSSFQQATYPLRKGLEVLGWS